MTNNVGFAFNVGYTAWAVSQLVLSKTNRIGDTKHNIQCNQLMKAKPNKFNVQKLEVCY